MVKPAPNVLGIFPPPDRDACLHAISRALLRIRSERGLHCAEIAKLADCSADTIENATNEKSLLSFDAVARLGFYFPEEFGVVEALWQCRASQDVTVSEKFDAIHVALERLRKECAA